MRVQTQAWWLPKAGNAADDYEDAFWPPGPVDRDARSFRAAVADGATETSFSALWAQLLVHAWCRGQLSQRRLGSSLPRLQQAWRDRVARRPLPWYAEEKLRSGAFSSLVGVILRQDDHEEGRIGTWTALAVGDSCLFQMREDELLGAFPLDRAARFTSRPHLLSSNPGGNNGLAAATSRVSGSWVAGDVFFLMTDALACWFLGRAEAGSRPWRALAELPKNGPDSFEPLMRDLRREGAMRNDDITLVSLSLSA